MGATRIANLGQVGRSIVDKNVGKDKKPVATPQREYLSLNSLEADKMANLI